MGQLIFRVTHVKLNTYYEDYDQLHNTNLEILPCDRIDMLKRIIILRGNT